MYEHLWSPKCPKNQKATTICLSHNCSQSPFQCQTSLCPCKQVHSKCKIMQWQAVRQYLTNWKGSVCKEGRQYMNRVEKIFCNLKSRLEREESLFHEYCKDNFLGKDYSKFMYLLEKKEQKGITSHLVSSALRNMTEPIKTKHFNAFTISEMQTIDRMTDSLFATLDKVYKSKEQQKPQVEMISRCNSATLERSKTRTKSTVGSEFSNKSILNEMVSLKLDLSYPKTINSKLINSASAINKFLNRKVKKYHLVYRASESSFSIQHFYHIMQTTEKNLIDSAQKNHKKIELMSLILVRNEYGKTLGGFTPLKWEQPLSQQCEQSDEDELNPERSRTSSKLSKFKGDPTGKTSFFSLDLMQRYDLNKPEEAIYCGRKSIGFGKGDFKILDKGHILRKNSCNFPCSYNYTARPYTNWSKSGMQLGGGRYSLSFKLTQWQAFLIEF